MAVNGFIGRGGTPNPRLGRPGTVRPPGFNLRVGQSFLQGAGGQFNPQMPQSYLAPGAHPQTATVPTDATVGVTPGYNPQTGTSSITGHGGTPDPIAGGQTLGPPSKGGPKGPSPFDAEYYANVANYLFKTNNAINQAQQQEGYDRTALQAALGQLQYQQPRANLALEERANQAGSLYSSAYGQQLGDLNNQFATKGSGLQSATGNKLAQLAQQIASLRGGIPLYENSQAYASALRQAQAAAKNPALGYTPGGKGKGKGGGGKGRGGHGGKNGGRGGHGQGGRSTLTGG